MLKGLYVLGEEPLRLIYGEPERARLAELVDIYAPPQTAESVHANPSVLAEADVILSGWGCPVFDAELLAAAPRLKAVFYGSGSIKELVTDAFWARGIVISSAWAANAVPVVEYALAHILFGLKCGWQHVASLKREKRTVRYPVAGAFGSTVGIVSLGMIGRMVVERLKTFDVRIIAYDPYVTPAQGAQSGVEMVTLDELFRRADVVSVHTPWLKETEGLISGAHLASMKPYSTFINSSRGAVVREDEMIAVLQQRADLVAVLDVTHPEPPAPDSPLYTLTNVVLTPHIAGSMDSECRRMGQYMIAELERYIAGQPLQYSLTRERAAIMA
ncbi:MAG: hydroxyacid dehydrogenase [Chloroflexi bacterium]|nr:hydroxyacid dehydrogenase [Chloroflexota bacterium]MCL5275386.1 hydroxyacid dehydrogenase [Chloroflexota bacterium]